MTKTITWYRTVTKVSSNKDGSFTVAADGKIYNFTDYTIKSYDKTSGKLVRETVRNNSKTTSQTVFSNGYTTTYTDFSNEKWTKAESVYNDGCKVKYSRIFNEDGSYTRFENKYNADGEIVEIRTSIYDNLDRMITSEEYVGGKFENGEYKGGQCNIRTREYDGNETNYKKCTRTGYKNNAGTIEYDTKQNMYTCKINKNSKNIIEYKEYEFQNKEQSIANVSLTRGENTKKQTCYFDLKDEQGLKYRYYISDNGQIEMWHFNSAGVRTKVTVTNPDGNQTVYNYNAAGQKTSTTNCKVDLQKDIIDKYGKDKDGNYLKYQNN